jgi:hypothetical protein
MNHASDLGKSSIFDSEGLILPKKIENKMMN